ncbi:hypothetical protein [Actinoplanes sp. NPDC049599]|uniref:hypothetical protein n=1 Tax=Actinoplanes sp. NPDC049599 TaxID=3363903 RepID=UPI00378FD8B2
MATVARLLPRHWDGRRLLQFLTGLALIALAFTLPALLDQGGPAADAPVTVITTVDTPLPPGLPLTEAPEQTRAGADQAGLALEADSTDPATASEDAGSAQDTDGGNQGAAPIDAGVVQGPAGLPVQGRHGGRICVEARSAAGSSSQRTHSERGPPRA